MGIGLRNILVTGSNGQLGLSLKELSSQYGYICKFKSKKELDINNTRQIKNIIINEKIDIIINCAAYTDVKNAERDRKKANIINNLAVEKLVKQCCKHETQLIHISTDYVFDGNQQHPYTETSSTNPLNYYGLTKLKGENKILNSKLYKSIIIRTSWLYSISENNFVSEILKKISKSENFSVVDNEIGSPTNSLDLAKVIFEIIPLLKNKKPEIYHFSNKGFCSRFEFASKINNYLKGKSIITPFQKNKLNNIRPKFSALDSNKISKNFDFSINDWSESLQKHLKQNNILNTYEFQM